MKENIESYLKRLDMALKGIGISKKIKILEEAKTKLEKGNDLPIPEEYAKKYLPEEKGIGCFILFMKLSLLISLLFIGIIGFIAWKYSPFIEVSENEKIIKLFAGSIELNFEHGRFKFGDYQASSGGEDFNGLQETKNLKLVTLKYLNGNIKVNKSKDSNLRWLCKIPDSTKGSVEKRGDVFFVNMEKQLGVDCKVDLPVNIGIKLIGNNGNIELSNLESSIEIELNNGNINIDLDEALFKEDIDLKMGNVQPFGFSYDGKYLLKITMEAGNIQK